MMTCSCREEKDKWIRAKYELCEFLPPLPYGDIALSQASDVLCILTKWYVMNLAVVKWKIKIASACCRGTLMHCIKMTEHTPKQFLLSCSHITQIFLAKPQ